MSKTITTFDRRVCAELGAAIEAALQSVADEYGVQIKQGRGTYSESTFSMKIEVATIGEGGLARTKESIAFLTNARMYGLDPKDLFATFRVKGTDYVLIGCKTRSPKFPMLGRSASDGKTYKFRERTVAAGLTLSAGVPS